MTFPSEVTKLTVDPPSQTVELGTNFTIAIKVENAPYWGVWSWQAYLQWDASILTFVSAEEGPFLKEWAEQHWAETLFGAPHDTNYVLLGCDIAILLPIPGDIEPLGGDGDVDSGDLGILRKAYGTSPPSIPECDLDGDLDVDLNDLYILARNYGETHPPRGRDGSGYLAYVTFTAVKKGYSDLTYVLPGIFTWLLNKEGYTIDFEAVNGNVTVT